MKRIPFLLLLIASLTFSISCKKDVGEVFQTSTIGKPGSKMGEFHFNSGNDNGWVADYDGSFLYVSDRENRRVQRFYTNGMVKDWWGKLKGKWGYHTDDVPADSGFYPTKIVAKNGNLFVGGYLEQEFKDVVFKISSSGDIVAIFPIRVLGFSSMCVDSEENIFVYWDNEIKKYDKNGNSVLMFGGYGIEDGLFSNDGYTVQIVVDDNDNIYVPDPRSDRVQKFDNKGKFLKKWEIDPVSDDVSSSFNEGKIYFYENDYLVAYDKEGEVVSRWETDELHSQQQILVVDKLLYHPYDYEDEIKVFVLVD